MRDQNTLLQLIGGETANCINSNSFTILEWCILSFQAGHNDTLDKVALCQQEQD